MSLDLFFFPPFEAFFRLRLNNPSACGGIFSAPTSRKKRHKGKLCVKNTLFRGKGRLFTVPDHKQNLTIVPRRLTLQEICLPVR